MRLNLSGLEGHSKTVVAGFSLSQGAASEARCHELGEGATPTPATNLCVGSTEGRTAMGARKRRRSESIGMGLATHRTVLRRECRLTPSWCRIQLNAPIYAGAARKDVPISREQVASSDRRYRCWGLRRVKPTTVSACQAAHPAPIYGGAQNGDAAREKRDSSCEC